MIGIPYLLSIGSKTALFKFSSTKVVESLFEDLGRADSNRLAKIYFCVCF